MKRLFSLIVGLSLSLGVLSTPTVVNAQQESPQTFVRGTITQVLKEEQLTSDEPGFIQTLEVARADTGEKVAVVAGSRFQPIPLEQRLQAGQTVVVTAVEEQGQTVWVLADSNYRIPVLVALLVIFFVLVIAVARLQGILSIVGMLGSLVVLTIYIIPQILTGGNPVLISIGSALIIGSISMYLSHGWSLKSHIALGSMVLTLVTVALLSSATLAIARMSGMGSEEAVFLQLEPNVQLNMRGLLLAGIVLGALGVLDDITVSQVSIVKQLLKAKPHIGFGELFGRAMQVGKDHIASLVNTLVLAYAASSLPLLLLKLNNTGPLWVMLNDEMIAEEVIRTLSGSIGLVLAVPLTTFLAAMVFVKKQGK